MIQLKELIIICNGYNQIFNHKNIFEQININGIREGGSNIIIFDADYTGFEKDHGYANKTKYLDEQKLKLGIDFDLFLFPNHKDDGTLETILESCINPANKEILDCWNNFEECVSIKNNSYTIPADKSKIYVYLECLSGRTNEEKEKIKDRNRDFKLTNNWIIDAKENQNLAILKTLLDKYFI